MANAADAIPPNADKVLFAEDLINFVLCNLNGISYPSWRAGDFREFIYNGFNEDVRKAVEYTIRVLEWEMDEHFSAMHEINAVNIVTFMDYAQQYRIAFLNEGLEPGKFLLYCVRLAYLASYFFTYHVKEALDKSLEYILVIFEEYDMYLGGWDAINSVAKRCAILSSDLNNLLTPEISDLDTDESSDQSEDENERNVYLLQRVEPEAEELEELPNQSDSKEQDKNNNFMKGGKEVNCFAEDMEVPSNGNSDQSNRKEEWNVNLSQRVEPEAEKLEELPNQRNSKEQGKNYNYMKGGKEQVNCFAEDIEVQSGRNSDQSNNEKERNVHLLQRVELVLEELPNQRDSKEQGKNNFMKSGKEVNCLAEEIEVPSGRNSDQSNNEKERKVHLLKKVELDAKQLEEMPNQRGSKEQSKNSNYIEGRNELNCFAEDIEVPLDGSYDQRSSKDEAECNPSQNTPHRKRCFIFKEGISSENPPKLENQQYDKGSVCLQSPYFEFPNREFGSCRNANYDNCKNEEEIDYMSLINGRNINLFIDKLRTLSSRKRNNVEHIDEQTECKFKRLKSMDQEVYCFESDESSGKNSNFLHKEGEKKTGVVLLCECGMLTKNNQLGLKETVKNLSDGVIYVSRHQVSCLERINFNKVDQSNHDTKFGQLAFLQRKDNDLQFHKEFMNHHNDELKLANLRCLCSETSSNIGQMND